MTRPDALTKRANNRLSRFTAVYRGASPSRSGDTWTISRTAELIALDASRRTTHRRALGLFGDAQNRPSLTPTHPRGRGSTVADAQGVLRHTSVTREWRKCDFSARGFGMDELAQPAEHVWIRGGENAVAEVEDVAGSPARPRQDVSSPCRNA